MSKKPRIRFKGFTDDWEQRKVGDIADIKTGPFGSTLHADDYVDDGVPIITTEHFKSGHLSVEKIGIPQVSSDDYSRPSIYTLRTNDIVFLRVGSVDINALITPFQDKWLFSGEYYVFAHLLQLIVFFFIHYWKLILFVIVLSLVQ